MGKKEIPDSTGDFEAAGKPGDEIVPETTDGIGYSKEALKAFATGGPQRLGAFMENPLMTEEDI